MTTDNLSIKNSNNYVDQKQNIKEVSREDNVFANGTAGASFIQPEQNTADVSLDNAKKKQTIANQQMIDNAIKEAIKGTDLSLDEAKKMLLSLNTDKKNVNIDTLTKALNCLKYAIADSTDNKGKLDKERLQKIFGCYVFMTIMSDKKNVSCEEARKVMNMSLIQFVIANNPNLKNIKNITATEVKDSLKIFVKKNFTQEKLQELAKAPESAKSAIRFMFGMLLSNCKEDELNLLFKAFVMLLQDQEMVEHVPVLIKEVCDTLKNDKSGRLEQFLQNDLTKILSSLGFKPETINKLKELGLFENINADNIGDLLNGGLQFLLNLKDPNELEILLNALNVVSTGGQLNNAQIEVLNKYKDQLDSLIAVIGKIANNPELIKGHEELFKQIQQILHEKGLDTYVYSGVQSLFNQYPDLFNNCKSQDDLTKILNKLTDNNYGEVVGDTNPENLYKGSNNVEKSDFGLPQRTTLESFQMSWLRKQDLEVALVETNKSKEPEFLVLANASNNKSESVTIPWQKYQSVKSLTAKDLYEGLSSNYIKIDDLLNNYKDLTDSAKMFINKLIEVMSPAEQSFRLDGMANREALDIIRHAHLNPEDLHLALDFTSNKELEKMKEEKEIAEGKQLLS